MQNCKNKLKINKTDLKNILVHAVFCVIQQIHLGPTNLSNAEYYQSVGNENGIGKEKSCRKTINQVEHKNLGEKRVLNGFIWIHIIKDSRGR